jgi:hypothetical protein
MRLALLGAFMTTSIATVLVYFKPQSAGNTGFSVSMASKDTLFSVDSCEADDCIVAFSGKILLWVRVLNEFEVTGRSIALIY